MPAMQLPRLLISAAEVLIAHVQQLGDGVMPALAGGGVFSWKGEEALALEVANADNHQTTYGVLAAALLALCQYMSETGDAARASFDVYDGPNRVGAGWIG
ncbi:MAG: hypothetical protein FRX48_04540 [Lasallia pustulata]|uniref:Uncharacterized protein n=1 Tax=Lasallia pustulata TaxID=136370 RepID=A0A5M8PP44_9LECA|nr:MAG: hypothetical protein FRX48_04540 [Lasallia pustulata]